MGFTAAYETTGIHLKSTVRFLPPGGFRRPPFANLLPLGKALPRRLFMFGALRTFRFSVDFVLILSPFSCLPFYKILEFIHISIDRFPIF